MEIIYYLQANTSVFLLAIFLLSLCIGSFLNVVIYRLPIMLNTSWRRECHEYLELTAEQVETKPFNLLVPLSHCPKCQKSIKPWQNIPLFSYILLRGKCGNCKTNISPRYPIIEICTALLSFIVAFNFGFSVETGFALILTWSLICLSMIDFDEQILPDSINICLLWLGIIANIFNLFAPLQDAVIGAIAGYLSLWTFAKLFKLLTGKDGMGHGDFKLLAALGAWVGWQMLPFIILCSSLVGAVIGISLIIIRGRDRNLPIPFGPYLAIAGWIALLWGNDIVSAYIQYAGF